MRLLLKVSPFKALGCRRAFLAGLFFTFSIPSFSQTPQPDTVREPADLRLLLHYYDQDGDHSAVTGGRGGESLQDRSTHIVLNVPVDSTGRLKVNGGLNYYTTASTDRISSISSASHEDLRVDAEVVYVHAQKRTRPKGFIVSGSSETDYMSSSIGVIWGRQNQDASRVLDITARAWLDKWMIVLPDELRSTHWSDFPTDKRRSALLGLTYRHELNRRSLVSITFDPMLQWGLLSTPFHRVIRSDSVVTTELLPGMRWRVPLGLRFNHNLEGGVILRFFSRLYADNFGIRSVTAAFDPVIHVMEALKLKPGYRFYAQSASRHFLPFMEADAVQPFRTSDYDLSAFSSQRLNLLLALEPVKGILRLSKNFWLGAITAGYYRYWRSDGLQAWWVSADVKWLMW